MLGVWVDGRGSDGGIAGRGRILTFYILSTKSTPVVGSQAVQYMFDVQPCRQRAKSGKQWLTRALIADTKHAT